MAERMDYTDCPGMMLEKFGNRYTTEKRTDDKGRTYFLHRVELPMKHTESLTVKVRGDAGGACKFWCYPVIGIPASRRSAVLETLNELTGRYRFVRLELDEDNDVCASYDFWQGGDEQAAIRIGRMSLMTFAAVVEECVPEILKAQYREEQEVTILKMDPFANEEE